MNDPSAPSFLRIHRGPASNSTETDSSSVPLESGNAVGSFWGKFESTTGWRLAPRSRRVGGALALMPAIDNTTHDPIVLDHFGSGPDGNADSDEAFEEAFVDSLTQVTAVGKAAATDLASAASELIGELNEARQAIRTQHAELAARANVVIGADHQAGLADRIEEILADASEACGCQAAAIYTLDDDTSELQIRSVYGLPDSRLTAGPRPLQGARGDLEAMVKNVVTIDDLNAGPIDTWNAPEPAAAAICAVISAADVPMGSLWFFAEDTKQFGPADVALARLAARSVATELASAVEDPFASPVSLASGKVVEPQPASTVTSTVGKTAGTASTAANAKNDIRDVANWQFQALPIGTAIAEDWKVDGMIESPNDYAIGWHTWDVLPDGSIQMAIAEAVQADITGAMSATVARAAMAAHSGYRHTPTQMLSRISDTLWQTSLGEQLMSMMYIRVDPETGEGEIASAGLITAMIASRMGYRPVMAGKSDPLCSHIDSKSVQETFRLMKGESLLAYSPGFLDGGISHTAIGGMLHDAMKSAESKTTDANPLAAIRRSLANQPLSCERGAAALVRI